MASMLRDIVQLITYHQWANVRLLDAAGACDREQWTRELGGSFPTLREVFTHLSVADWLWLRRWQGEPAPVVPADWSFDSAAALAPRWRELQQAQLAFAARLTEGALAEPIVFRARSGVTYELPLTHAIRHVVNHGTYHRGQAAAMLRQLGIAPPATDLYLFTVEEGRGRVVGRMSQPAGG